MAGDPVSVSFSPSVCLEPSALRSFSALRTPEPQLSQHQESVPEALQLPRYRGTSNERIPWRPTRGSLTSPSYLVRNRSLGPPLEQFQLIIPGCDSV